MTHLPEFTTVENEHEGRKSAVAKYFYVLIKKIVIIIVTIFLV